MTKPGFVNETEQGMGSRVALYAVFFCSGWAALVYEVSWNRQLGSLFGHTVHAAAVVLCAYFAGLAIGYGIAPRIAMRMRAARGYALCEAIAGLWAAALPSLLSWSEASGLREWLQHDQPTLQWASRIVYCLLILAPATIALGATLPLMAEMLAADQRFARSRATMAYAINTFGALVGVLMASSWLLAAIGVTQITKLAALISIGCAATAWMIAGRSSIPSTEPAPNDGSDASVLYADRLNHPTALLVVAISGAATLILEVLYARLFSLVFHNSTYTFSFVLIAFLLGITLGSLVSRWLVLRFAPESIIGIAGWCGGLVTVGSVYAFLYLTKLDYFRGGSTFVSYFAQSLLMVLSLAGLPAIALGMILPVAWQSHRQSKQRTAKSIGQLTLVNTIAASIGAISASFLLLPWIGLWQSFVCVALLCLIPFLILCQHPRRWLLAGVSLTSIILLALPLLRSNPESWVRRNRHEQLIQRWHSPYGWIDVVEIQPIGTRKVQQNLHYRFGATGADATREFRQAHLPLLLHPAPRDVLFLGLGTGMTAAGAVPHRSLNSIEIVELIPEVVDAARLLRDENRNVVDDPRTRIFTDDARHHLRTTSERYDVIVADLFVPWESETGYLYTREHYERARICLRDQGIFCQWLAMYQLGAREFEMIADTMRSVFPHVTLWWGRQTSDRSVIAFIGSAAPLNISIDSVNQRIALMRREDGFDDPLLADAQKMSELYLGAWPAHPKARLNTDEHPWIEFEAPISHQNNDLLSGPRYREYLKKVSDTFLAK